MRRLETILQRLFYCLGKEMVSPKKICQSVSRAGLSYS